MDPREGRSFKQQALFGGRGEVIVRDLLEGASCPPFDAALVCELEPSGLIGRHRQADCHELVFILSGEGQATVGDTRHRLQPATTLYLPLGQILSLENTSDTEALRYMIVKSRP